MLVPIRQEGDSIPNFQLGQAWSLKVDLSLHTFLNFYLKLFFRGNIMPMKVYSKFPFVYKFIR